MTKIYDLPFCCFEVLDNFKSSILAIFVMNLL